MSIFTTVGLAIVLYFAFGGLILGLIKDDFELGTNIVYWPVIVIHFISDVFMDLYNAVYEQTSKWRKIHE